MGTDEERIRWTARVAQASNNITERRLKCYGHLMERDEERILRDVQTTDIREKPKTGRPKTRQKDDNDNVLNFTYSKTCSSIVCEKSTHDLYYNCLTVCMSRFANCRSQFFLDRLGRYIKLLVSIVILSSHKFASKFGLAMFYRRNHRKTITKTESPRECSVE